jgi:hypothetical protein
MRGTRILLVLLGAHVVVKVALFPLISHAPLVGDEASYVDGARALSNLVRDLGGFGPIDGDELRRNVVGSGWFMPGMSLLLTPLFVVDPDASVTMIRAYLGVATTVLLVLTMLSVRRVLGDVYAALVLVLPGLVPMWLLFSYCAWGDLVAGLLVLVLVAQLVSVVRSLGERTAPSVRDGLRLGALAIAVVYFRSSALLLVAAVGVVAMALALLVLRDKERRRGLAAVAAAAVVFVAILLPWSVFASHTLGDRVVTTTSVPTVMANTFGDRDRVCFGECDPNSSIWFSPLRYSREVARATGLSEVEVQRQMSAYARSDVTAHSYADDVITNTRAYTTEPAHFASFLKAPGDEAKAAERLRDVAVATTNVMFLAMLAVAAAMLLTVFRGPFEAQVVNTLVKVGLGALLTQPFVHISGSRYWSSAAPLCALAAGLLLTTLLQRRSKHPPPTPPAPTVLRRALTATQAGLSVAAVAVVVGVLALAQ